MTEIGDFKEGDRVLFNDRKQPLQVVSDGEELDVQGPSGGEYVIYEADSGDLLVSKKGNKRYSSYVENLRKVGEWKEDDDLEWNHSGTNAQISVEQLETGNWKIIRENFHVEVDQPKYGFLEKEAAVEEAEKLIRKHPEGKV